LRDGYAKVREAAMEEMTLLDAAPVETCGSKLDGSVERP